jgi:hypothetical protein
MILILEGLNCLFHEGLFLLAIERGAHSLMFGATSENGARDQDRDSATGHGMGIPVTTGRIILMQPILGRCVSVRC